MTVSSTTSSETFACNGVTTVFVAPFRVLAVDAMRGYLLTIATGESTPLINGTDFTVTGVGGANTTVTTAVAYSSLYRFHVKRSTPRLQETDYRDNDPFPAESHEACLDRLTHIVQEDDETLSRALVWPDGETAPVMPLPADRANKVWANNAAGDLVFVVPTDGSVGSFALDLANNASAIKGAGMVGYAGSGFSYPAGTVGARLQEVVTASDFGAVGDGVADDTAALQAMLTHLAVNGGTGLLGAGEYLITSGLVLVAPAKSFRFEGTGPASVIKQRTASAATAVSITKPVGVRLAHFRIDAGHSVTGFSSHGISISDPTRTTVDDVEVFDYRMTGVMMFVTVQDTYGDSFIANCKTDGNGNGQNGVLLEGLARSGIINCTARRLDMAGSPCNGLQLKNKCKHSYILGGVAESCKAGVAFGGDGVVAGTGPDYCVVRGVVTKDCIDGGLFGKSTNCDVEFTADMAASPAGGYALNVAGFNAFLRATVSLYNVQAGRTALRVGSDDTSVRVPFANSFGAYLLRIEAGVNRSRTIVDDIAGAALPRLPDVVIDDSGNTDNEILFLRDLPCQGLDSGVAVLRFNTPGKQNYISYSATTDAFTMRHDGTDRYLFGPDEFQPSPDDALTLGSVSRRWSVVYAATGTINTSDERAKADIASAADLVLDAWAGVEWVGFKFADAVERKGSSARLHFGLIAQRVRDAFAAAGLDAFEFGLLCYDKWIDDETGEEMDRYGVRYEEALALEAALTRRSLARLSQRIAASAV